MLIAGKDLFLTSHNTFFSVPLMSFVSTSVKEIHVYLLFPPMWSLKAVGENPCQNHLFMLCMASIVSYT